MLCVKKKFFLSVHPYVLLLSFLLGSCGFSLLGGPFSEAFPQNEEHENNDFEERGFRVWIDGPSLYERGLMRVIAEDFGDGSMPPRYEEDFKSKTRGYFKSQRSGSFLEYPVVWGFDWYAKPLRKGRIIFEVNIPQGIPEHSSLLRSGYNSIIALRLMFPLNETVTEYDSLHVSTSATNTSIQELETPRSDFRDMQDPRLNSESYYRIDTVRRQKRADMLFLSDRFPSFFVQSNQTSLPVDMRPVLFVFSPVVGSHQLPKLFSENAFGLPIEIGGSVNPPGNLEFRLFDSDRNEVANYLLNLEQVTLLRNIFLGRDLETSPLMAVYNEYQSYEIASENIDGIEFKTASVSRRNESGLLCKTVIKIAGLSTVGEDDDEIILEYDRCLINGSSYANTWDEISDFSSVMLTAYTRSGTLQYHLTPSLVKEEYRSQAFEITSTQNKVHFKRDWFSDVSGQVLLKAWMKAFRPGTLLSVYQTTSDTLIDGFRDSGLNPETLIIAFYPSKNDMLDSHTRQAAVYSWWPLEEFEKIRTAFNQ